MNNAQSGFTRTTRRFWAAMLLLHASAAPLTAQPLATNNTPPPSATEEGFRTPAANAMLGDGGTGPFYQWETAIPESAPQILRLERFSSRHSLAEAAVSERILYTSRGGPDGTRPIVVSAGVYLPRGSAPPGGWPVIAWAHGTVGLPDICAPTFNGWSERDTQYLNNWLREGYAVVASDYEGMGTNGPHPYMLSRSAATGTLHAVVAAQARYPLANDVVVVGQSQGAHTAANAGLMHAAIAPTLNIRGLVLTGWPGSMAMPALQMDIHNPWSVFYLRGLPTYAAIDPDFRPESVLTEHGLETYAAFLNSCGSNASRAFWARQPVTNTLFTRNITDLEERAQPLRAYPPLRFPMPVFLGIGLADEQTFPRPTFDAAKQACALGSDIGIHLYPGFNHAGTVLRSQQDSLAWVRAAFAGATPPGRCEDATFPDP